MVLGVLLLIVAFIAITVAAAFYVASFFGVSVWLVLALVWLVSLATKSSITTK